LGWSKVNTTNHLFHSKVLQRGGLRTHGAIELRIIRSCYLAQPVGQGSSPRNTL
jgi:hypothetical protein